MTIFLLGRRWSIFSFLLEVFFHGRRCCILVLLWEGDYDYFSFMQTWQCFQFCCGTVTMTIFLLDRRCSVLNFLWEGFYDYFSSWQTLQCF